MAEDPDVAQARVFLQALIEETTAVAAQLDDARQARRRSSGPGQHSTRSVARAAAQGPQADAAGAVPPVGESARQVLAGRGVTITCANNMAGTLAQW